MSSSCLPDWKDALKRFLEDILLVFETPIDGGRRDVPLAGDPPEGGIRITFGDGFLLRRFDASTSADGS
jgi:hypothetical protein